MAAHRGREGEEVRPSRPFAQSGFGALEVAARYERLTFGSTDDQGEPAFANPRAVNLLRNRDDAWTFGLSWIRIAGSSCRPTPSASRSANRPGPDVGVPVHWSFVGRFQFAMYRRPLSAPRRSGSASRGGPRPRSSVSVCEANVSEGEVGRALGGRREEVDGLVEALAVRGSRACRPRR